MNKTRKQHQDVLEGFLPYIGKWFAKTFDAPSPAQVQAWPAIRRGENTLLLAPTGSGKTLAAFMCAIDDLFRKAQDGGLVDGVRVLYITPLKALGNDIHKNLLVPLAGIRKQTRKKLPDIRVAVRSGDTPQSERARMVRQPPHILITTPESLYLLLQSKQMADALTTVRTVIVDEVHSLCDNKRGVHLAVSLERLARRCVRPPQRVGCSATISPLAEIASFLVGQDDEGTRRACTIVNAGRRKDLDVRVMAPLPDFLEASHTALWASAYDLLIGEIRDHDTTLIFCNSRYKAERTALRLKELAGDKVRIGVHHGSMSKERRLEAEEDLKNGALDALVATTSLELGIDIGSIDLVYQLESPKSIATGLQRIGRAGHLLGATSKGRILVFERDELMEAAAICRAMTHGEIDDVTVLRNCLDVLAQQVAGAVTAGNWQADELFALVCRSYPYAELKRADFDAVLAMVAGEHPFEMAMPPRSLALWDRTTGRVVAERRTKQLTAMNVGTIGENSEYDVVIEGTKKRVGKVQSAFVDDSLRTNDVFVLGSTSWRVAGKQRNQLLVKEAPGATPTVPWWHGPIPPRSSGTGIRVGMLRRDVASRLGKEGMLPWIESEYHMSEDAAVAMSDYIREQVSVSETVPDHERILVESWRDELGRENIIIYCPLGRRINHTWGVALSALAKKRFRHDWTVAATNDLILLTYHEAQAPPVRKPDARELLGALTSANVIEFVDIASEDAVTSGTAFRDVATFALQIPRFEQGRRVPVWIQNYRAEDLFEAAKGSERYPVLAELRRNYIEASLDQSGLASMLGRIEGRECELIHRRTDSPSPFAHAFLVQDFYRSEHQMGRERRANLLRLHRRVLQQVLSSAQMAELLDGRAIQRLELRLSRRSEAVRARTSDELAAAIRELGDIAADMDAVSAIVQGDAVKLLKPLIRDHRVVAVEVPGREEHPSRLVATEMWRQYHDAFQPGQRGRALSVQLPQIRKGSIAGFEALPAAEVIPDKWRKKQDRDSARRMIVERYLKCRGPVTVYEIVNASGWPIGIASGILEGLVASGSVAKGVYSGDKPRPQYVNKVNLEEIHRLTMGYLKRELASCAPHEVVDFMTRWQHVHPDTQLEGLDGLRVVIRQLQGFEIVTGALESEMLAGRIRDYRPAMLEQLIAAGEVQWRRTGIARVTRGKIALCLRRDADWLAGGRPVCFDTAQSADADIRDEILCVRDYFIANRTAFFDDVVADLGLPEGPVTRAVWYLAWAGELTCDTYECLRYSNFSVTMSACYDLDSTPRKIVSGRMSADRVMKQMSRRRLDPRLGRWSATERLVDGTGLPTPKEVVKRWVGQLLERWGIVTRDMLCAEVSAPAWGDMLPEFKRLELLGELRRGYFIESHHGEQYALPAAVDLLRDCRARRHDGNDLGYQPDEAIFCISSRDPANLYASSLDIINEHGDVFKRHARRGNFVHRVVVQAGQALLYNSMQIVALTREQLERSIACQMGDAARSNMELVIRHWNRYPVDVSPVLPVLEKLGFRVNSRREMVYPPRKSAASRRSTPSGARRVPRHSVFLPYCDEPPPVVYNLDWTCSRVHENVREKVREVLVLLDQHMPKDCTAVYGAERMHYEYRGKVCLAPHVNQRQIRLSIVRPPWNADIQIDSDTDIQTPGFIEQMLEQCRKRKEWIDGKLGPA